MECGDSSPLSKVLTSQRTPKELQLPGVARFALTPGYYLHAGSMMTPSLSVVTRSALATSVVLLVSPSFFAARVRRVLRFPIQPGQGRCRDRSY
jgi:hypothetical protein